MKLKGRSNKSMEIVPLKFPRQLLSVLYKVDPYILKSEFQKCTNNFCPISWKRQSTPWQHK